MRIIVLEHLDRPLQTLESDRIAPAKHHCERNAHIPGGDIAQSAQIVPPAWVLFDKALSDVSTPVVGVFQVGGHERDLLSNVSLDSRLYELDVIGIGKLDKGEIDLYIAIEGRADASGVHGNVNGRCGNDPPAPGKP